MRVSDVGDRSDAAGEFGRVCAPVADAAEPARIQMEHLEAE